MGHRSRVGRGSTNGLTNVDGSHGPACLVENGGMGNIHIGYQQVIVDTR